ncbi:T9SS type A sorting domain-containing protein [Pontibacter anaerobius]|uniref:T9SS type A sorting domain-containing protein n=1 Tax=Pontibacter anaerobius TaxID=2993940 RepID=A0ABT3RD83_9BACT|nr:T9SS type A sorting domain-containing protein [Pontibacter anaerobius]MCX2739500.1 T9SS type A sorting domain-containing protein [Pontibacter anaerobius]
MKTIVLQHVGALRVLPSKCKLLPLLAFGLSMVLALSLSEQATAQSKTQLLSPVIWLRADSGTVSPAVWSDWRGEKLSATALSGAGPSVKGELNYNRTLVFDGVNDYMRIPYSFELLPSLTVIAVYQPADTVERGLFGTEKALARNVMLSTKKSLGPDEAVDRFGENSKVPVLNTVIQSWSESAEVADSAYLALGSEGKGSTKSPFRGTVAELMIFDRSLSFLERVQAESYLAIKYGIPLRDRNYVSSAEEVLWHAEKNNGYSARITGLGRDDAFGLYQKQARSTVDTTNLLVISAGQLTSSNRQNKTRINDGDFLLWGDNTGQLTPKTGEGADSLITFMERQWLMDVTGTTASQVPTELRLDLSLLPKSSLGYWLVVDRSGQGGYAADKFEYIIADSVSADSIAYFSNMHWDTDNSGKDVFGLARATDMLAVLSGLNNPTCAAVDGGSAVINVVGGKAPFRYELSNASTGSSLKWEGAAQALQEQLAAGEYTLKVTDAAQLQVTRTFSLELPGTLLVDLGQDQQLEKDGEIFLDATASIPDSIPVTYKWESNYGFSSTEGRVRITEPGAYTVTVTNQHGCTFSDEVIVSGHEAENFKVFPNFISSGNTFQIGVSLKEKASVSVKVYDLKGNLHYKVGGENRTEYHFRIPTRSRGMYMVVLETPNGIKSEKIIVF